MGMLLSCMIIAGVADAAGCVVDARFSSSPIP
jgi:hypothetical protein